MKRNAFTLIEVAIVIAILAVLAALYIFGFNPLDQLARSRNNERSAHVNAIINAVGRRTADNKGNFENGCAAGEIPSTATNMGSGSGKYNIKPCIVPIYLNKMPYDPKDGSEADTKYQISKDSNGRITVSAPQAELGATISVSR